MRVLTLPGKKMETKREILAHKLNKEKRMWRLRLPGDSPPFFLNKLILTWTHTHTCTDRAEWGCLSYEQRPVRGVTSWWACVSVNSSNRPI